MQLGLTGFCFCFGYEFFAYTVGSKHTPKILMRNADPSITKAGARAFSCSIFLIISTACMKGFFSTSICIKHCSAGNLLEFSLSKILEVIPQVCTNASHSTIYIKHYHSTVRFENKFKNLEHISLVCVTTCFRGNITHSMLVLKKKTLYGFSRYDWRK